MIDYARTIIYNLPSNSANYVISDTICTTINLPRPESQLAEIIILNRSSINLNLVYPYTPTTTLLKPGATITLLPSNYEYIIVLKINPDSGPIGDFLPRDGSLPMLGNLDMNSHYLSNLNTPDSSYDGVNKQYVDMGFLKLNGTNQMTNNLNAGDYKIINVLDPVNMQDAATKKYVDGNKTSLILVTTLSTTTGAIPWSNWSYCDLYDSKPIRSSTSTNYIGFGPTSTLIGKRCEVTLSMTLPNAPSNVTVSGSVQLRRDFTIVDNYTVGWHSGGSTNSATSSIVFIHDIYANSNFVLSATGANNKQYYMTFRTIGAAGQGFNQL